jgi:hypothetical protein
MCVPNFSVINGPLLEAVELEEVALKGDVADEVKGFAGVTTSGRRKNRIVAAFEAASGSRGGV